MYNDGSYHVVPISYLIKKIGLKPNSTSKRIVRVMSIPVQESVGYTIVKSGEPESNPNWIDTPNQLTEKGIKYLLEVKMEPQNENYIKSLVKVLKGN